MTTPTPKQRAELTARECAEKLSERLFWNREARLQIIQPYQIDIQESIPLEQLFAVEDALRAVLESTYCRRAYEKMHQCRSAPRDDCECCNCSDCRNGQSALLALDNWRKEREKK